jgi:hypothetical protein
MCGRRQLGGTSVAAAQARIVKALLACEASFDGRREHEPHRQKGGATGFQGGVAGERFAVHRSECREQPARERRIDGISRDFEGGNRRFNVCSC